MSEYELSSARRGLALLRHAGRFAIVCVLGGLWPWAMLTAIPLADKVSFLIVTLIPTPRWLLTVADSVASITLAAGVVGALYGVALVALRSNRFPFLLLAFLAVAIVSSLIFWSFQYFDRNAIEVYGESISLAWWLGLAFAVGVVRMHRQDQSNKGR